jgi:hypothetical protein
LIAASPLLASYSGHGSKACRPDLMLRIVLFEMQRGRTSPAQWYLDTKENVALQWLGFSIRPARSVWYTFAFRVGPFVDRWNQEVLCTAHEQGHVSGQRAALDGTAVEANASRHRLLNQEQVAQRRQLLDETIQADAQGRALSALPGWMGQTPASRRAQSEQYQRAQTKLAERWAENQQRQPSKRQEGKHIRISVSDPEAALGKDKHKVYRPLYNVQYVRDVDSPFILGYETFARSSDTGTLLPMMGRTQQLTGRMPEKLLVDSGYITALDLADAQQLGIDLYGPWKENDYSEKEATSGRQLSKDQFRWLPQRREYR